MAEMMDSSLLMLVGGGPKDVLKGGRSPQDEQSERLELMEYMKQVCLGFERAPSHVVAAIDAALAVCQEWQARPRGKNVPLPPPSLRRGPSASEDADKDYQPNPKNIAYTPCVPGPPSVLAMMEVRKVSTPPEDQP